MLVSSFKVCFCFETLRRRNTEQRTFQHFYCNMFKHMVPRLLASIVQPIIMATAQEWSCQWGKKSVFIRLLWEKGKQSICLGPYYHIGPLTLGWARKCGAGRLRTGKLSRNYLTELSLCEFGSIGDSGETKRRTKMPWDQKISKIASSNTPLSKNPMLQQGPSIGPLCHWMFGR